MAINVDETDEQDKLVPIDLSDVNLPNEEVEIDSSEDAFTLAPPIPDGEYLCKAVLGSDGPGKRKDKRSGVVDYEVPIEFRVADGENKDAVLFFNAKTRVPRGKKTCTAAAVLIEAGVKLEGRVMKLDMVTALIKLLKKEPTFFVTSEWGAWDKEAGKNGRMIKRGMANFPEDGKGGHIPQVEVKPVNGSPYTVEARSRVVRIRSSKAGKAQGKATAAPKTASAPKASKEEVLDELE